jgi:NAD(P)-dependent dehydrogenase (short-subunit alcohol dehydrogenase family)
MSISTQQPALELAGTTALVTGATSGIGRATAIALAAAGANVLIHGRDANRGVAVLEQIELAGGHGRFVPADLSDPKNALVLANEVGEVDILVNNAGFSWFGPSEVGLAGGAAYGATKAALTAMTKGWAAEYSPAGVRVNAVAPGPIYTGGAASDRITALGETTLLGRAAQPEDIANTIEFLASPRAQYITGAVFAVDGGRTAI